MKHEIFRNKTAIELHARMGLEEPKHPLITIIDTAKVAITEEQIGMRVTSDMYHIALKDSSCGLDYGRNHLDFNEGTLVFMAPDQVFTFRKTQELNQVQGWLLYFHPDLIRGSDLAEKIDTYNFFSYDLYEALHLSEQEENTITQCVDMITTELNQRIDNHSQKVIASIIELLLNHCARFYQRQFITRSPKHKNIVTKVERLLKDYFSTGLASEIGVPSIQYLAEKCNVSTYYLSDLLKKEIGRTAKDHINDFIIEKAKNQLLSDDISVNEIAYSLGFNYPHYFSRLFKTKTGMTPLEYRKN